MKNSKGFTLVELAIVMIIIGLLIGGVLKGQELVGNAQIAATVAQVRAIDAATTTFRDKYDALPGDMPDPVGRVLNCIGACAATQAGSTILGNGRLDSAPTGAPNVENEAFFPQTAAADLISGATIQGGVTEWGQSYPAAKIRGGLRVGYGSGNALGVSLASPPGHYLYLCHAPSISVSRARILNGSEALRLDRKMDDGIINTGSVFASDPTCGYDELSTAASCNLLIRFQN